eukprot:TRINITY_DN6900_c0_g1_i2.p1 TRINITY_DN6900_c0_g1~~TRINITY_DN6900_c0_g1_i2.p1  ORF type:complete len:160 (+),score=29.02 TRINITY_DN6900_c0_g1_i2:44-523(+)
MDDTYTENINKLSSLSPCFDCNTPHAQWTSISHGIWLCLNCAGKHRSYGVHISSVRSASLDNWSEKNYLFIKLGGNERARAYFSQFEFESDYEMYHSKEACDYRNMLKKEVFVELGTEDEFVPLEWLPQKSVVKDYGGSVGYMPRSRDKDPLCPCCEIL